VTAGQRWSDPATWGGTLPTAGATVVIPAGRTIVLDTATPALKGLTIEGTLTAAPDADIGITADYIILRGGRLQIGSAAAPYLRNAVITLTGNTTADNPATLGFGNKVLGMMGGTLEMHGRPVAHSWTKLDGGDVAAGARQIRLAQAPGWRAGDQIVIATSSLNQNEYTLATVDAVNGTTVTLREPTRFRHFGEKRTVGDVSVDVRAEVGLLTHNIVIQGDASSTTSQIGGHIMLMSGGSGTTVQVANVQLQRMGQLNNLGRYPLHFHLMGNACSNCYVRNIAVRDTIQRGIVVHDTSNIMVAGNVVFNTVGHNIIIETETTRGNTLDGNLALVNREPNPRHTEPTLVTQNDQLPGNFWMRGADNAILNNVAAGSQANGFIYDAPGAGNFNFRNNVVHAAMGQQSTQRPGDFDIMAGLMIIASRPVGHQDQVLDTLAYHNQHGIWPEESPDSAYVIDRFIVAENSFTGVQNRGVGSKQIYRNGTFIGRLPNSTVLTQAGNAMHNQYGSDNLVENATFANYGAVSFTGTDTNPAQSSYTFRNARFIGTQGFDLAGDQGRMMFLDDSIRPRGFYVDVNAPWLAYPGCTTVPGGDNGHFRCEREPGIAELQMRTSAAAGFNGKTEAMLTRSDGLRYNRTSNGVAPGMHGPTVLHGVAGLSYAIETASAYYALQLMDTGGDPGVNAGSAATTMSVPMASAPRSVARVQRATDPDADFNAVPAPASGDALRAAASLAEFNASPLTTYFYDAAARRVWVSVTPRWTIVQQ
jgi:hypothetical protein